ncbi:MAG TPA: hypothetical protein VFU89_03395 [Rhabdochlamydiaceae bacterium]|nr:hypothetical protein [Rhabdochlamydiaceae bacterium]
MANAVINMKSPEARARHYKEITRLYTDNGMQRVKRHWAYMERSDLPLKRLAMASIAFGATAGAVAGKEAGELAVQTCFPEDADNSIKMKAGRCVGAFLGGATGAVVATYLYIFTTERTDRFTNWKEMMVNHALKEFITLHYSDDVVLTDHCCTISLAPMTTPARTPSGTYYDLEYILNCPRVINNDHMIRDPLRNEPFHEDAIVIDFERGVIINKRIRHLLNTDIAALGVGSPLRSSLIQQVAQIDAIIKNQYNSAKEVIEAKRRSNELTGSAYLTELGRFFTRCGETIETDLVWPN